MGTLNLQEANYQVDYTAEQTYTDPAAVYAAWATELGVSSTESSFEFPEWGETDGFAIPLAASPFANSTNTYCILSTDGAIGFYETLTGPVSGRYWTGLGYDALYGSYNQPKLLLAWAPTVNNPYGLNLFTKRMQVSGNTTIIYGQYNNYYYHNALYYDFAIRISPQSVLFVGSCIDQDRTIKLFELREQYSSNSPINLQSADIFSQTEGTIYTAQIDIIPPPPSVSGTITDDNGNPCQRTVRVYDRATGALIEEVLSNATTGAYKVVTSVAEVQRIVLDDSAGVVFNDLIDRVIPA